MQIPDPPLMNQILQDVEESTFFQVYLFSVCVCVRVCVCEREREREREKGKEREESVFRFS